MYFVIAWINQYIIPNFMEQKKVMWIWDNMRVNNKKKFFYFLVYQVNLPTFFVNIIDIYFICNKFDSLSPCKGIHF